MCLPQRWLFKLVGVAHFLSVCVVLETEPRVLINVGLASTLLLSCIFSL